ncbi:MAG: thermonuclease family protein [Eggerthellaceae bacterium]|nr:thermonuclease family protein [Eggerthellaceae bacterium]
MASDRVSFKWLRNVLLFAALLLAAVLAVACSDVPIGGQQHENYQPSAEELGLEEAIVVRVVDGDTFKVLREGGREEYLRLVGIDAPESVASDESRNTPEGVEASNYTKSLVSEGQRVWLQRDVSDADKYERLLRYMWLEVPVDPYDEDEIATKMLNAILVVNGYAQVKEYRPDTTLHELFEEFEDRAVAEGNGVSYMWS